MPKGISASLFTQVMVDNIEPYIKEVVAANPAAFPHGKRSVVFMMDRAPWHKKALKDGLMGKMGMLSSSAAAHPPNSPDMQAPIEQAHSALTRRVSMLLREYPDVRAPASVRALFEAAWSGGSFSPAEGMTVELEPLWTKEQVAAAFRALEHTYQQVVDAEGDWSAPGR